MWRRGGRGHEGRPISYAFFGPAAPGNNIYIEYVRVKHDLLGWVRLNWGEGTREGCHGGIVEWDGDGGACCRERAPTRGALTGVGWLARECWDGSGAGGRARWNRHLVATRRMVDEACCRRGGVAGAEPPHKGGPNRPDRPELQWSVVSGRWSETRFVCRKLEPGLTVAWLHPVAYESSAPFWFARRQEVRGWETLPGDRQYQE